MRNNFAEIVAGFASLISVFALSSCSLEGIRRELQSQDIHHVPSYMIEPREQLNYLVEHYWDKVNLKDTAWLSRRTELERQFMDYFALLDSRGAISQTNMLRPLEKMQGEMLTEALGYYRRAYYDLNSPYCNDELYRYVVIWAIHSPRVPREQQIAIRQSLKGLEYNRVGKPAKDIVYTNDSTTVRLLPIKQKYLLLSLTRPGDSTAVERHEYLKKREVYTRMTKARQLRVLNLYVGYQGDKSVLKPDSLLPTFVEKGIDTKDSIIQHSLYDLRRNPSLYLLGKDGKVLLRNPELDELSRYLETNEKN